MRKRFEMGTVEQIQNDAKVLRRSQDHYPIPDNAVPFFEPGSVATPIWGIANIVELCEYQCPIGWEGYLMGITLAVTGDGGTFVNGSGDVVFSVDIDRPLGAPLATGRFLAGYNAITSTLGDLSEPWPVARELRGWRMRTGETYRAKAYTVANVNTGNPCYCHGRLMGIVWPKC